MRWGGNVELEEGGQVILGRADEGDIEVEGDHWGEMEIIGRKKGG